MQQLRILIRLKAGAPDPDRLKAEALDPDHTSPQCFERIKKGTVPGSFFSFKY